MRRIRRILAIVTLLGLLGGVAAYFGADRLVGAAVTREATESLGVATSVGSTRISLDGGRLFLRDFTIDNPPGYSGGKLLDLGNAELALPLSQWRSRPVHVTRIDFVSPRLLLERCNGKWNVQVLGHTSPDPLRIYIDQVTVTDAIVTVKLNLTAGEKPMVVDIPPFTMENVRASDGSGRGATIKDVLLQITQVMTTKALSPTELARQIMQ